MVHRVAYPLFVLLGLAGLAGACAELDDRPATWSYVHATIIGPNCTTSNCHSELSRTADLALHDRDVAYGYLTGRACDPEADPDAAVHDFVVPYDPERSKLMYLLRGQQVRQMPPDAALPDTEIALVERWILEGAQCN